MRRLIINERERDVRRSEDVAVARGPGLRFGGGTGDLRPVLDDGERATAHRRGGHGQPEAEPRPVCFRLSPRRMDCLELVAAPLGARPSRRRGRRVSMGFRPPTSTIGDGYLWPDITIFSDGLQCFLVSAPSRSPDSLLFRYLGASRRPEVVPAKHLEEAIDGFVEDIPSRLEDRKLSDTNRHRLWKDLATERATPELARWRVRVPSLNSSTSPRGRSGRSWSIIGSIGRMRRVSSGTTPMRQELVHDPQPNLP